MAGRKGEGRADPAGRRSKAEDVAHEFIRRLRLVNQQLASDLEQCQKGKEENEFDSGLRPRKEDEHGEDRDGDFGRTGKAQQRRREIERAGQDALQKQRNLEIDVLQQPRVDDDCEKQGKSAEDQTWDESRAFQHGVRLFEESG